MLYLYFPVDKQEVILTYLYCGARRIVCVWSKLPKKIREAVFDTDGFQKDGRLRQ